MRLLSYLVTVVSLSQSKNEVWQNIEDIWEVIYISKSQWRTDLETPADALKRTCGNCDYVRVQVLGKRNEETEREERAYEHADECFCFFILLYHKCNWGAHWLFKSHRIDKRKGWRFYKKHDVIEKGEGK